MLHIDSLKNMEDDGQVTLMDTIMNPVSTLNRMNVTALVEREVNRVTLALNADSNQGPLKGMVQFYAAYSHGVGFHLHYWTDKSFRVRNRLKAYKGYFENLLEKKNQLMTQLTKIA